MSRLIDRRGCLRRMAAAAGAVAGGGLGSAGRALLAAPQGTSRASAAKVTVLLDGPIKDAAGKPAIVDPMLHSHFVEHLGGVVYDGIWVGPDSPVPNINGIRRSIVESLQRLGPPVIRWPGGCFADRYHWRDGIGPREQRPRRFGRWNEVTESNHFGTHEFMEFCRLVKAQPYFAANVGSGSPEEFQQWVEYCNAPAGRTTLADERVANGAAEPLGVRFWGVGNENWSCGGTFTPEDYCNEYRRFTTWAPSYGVPLFMIACGPTGNAKSDWTRRFMKKWADGFRAPLQGLSAHYYCGTSGTASEFTTVQWYDLLDKANQMEPFVLDEWAAMGEFDPQRQVKLILDEWGCWHPSGSEIKPGYAFSQTSTMRDALVAGLTLDTFHRHADKVLMSNVAQLVNCLQSLYLADGDRFCETVNYQVFAMYRSHQGGTATTMQVEAEPVRFNHEDKDRSIFRVAGSASRKENVLTVSLVHTHVAEPIAVTIDVRGGKAAVASHTWLAHAKLNAANTLDHPDEVRVRVADLPAPPGAGPIVVELPPASVSVLRIELG